MEEDILFIPEDLEEDAPPRPPSPLREKKYFRKFVNKKIAWNFVHNSNKPIDEQESLAEFMKRKARPNDPKFGEKTREYKQMMDAFNAGVQEAKELNLKWKAAKSAQPPPPQQLALLPPQPPPPPQTLNKEAIDSMLQLDREKMPRLQVEEEIEKWDGKDKSTLIISIYEARNRTNQQNRELELKEKQAINACLSHFLHKIGANGNASGKT